MTAILNEVQFAIVGQWLTSVVGPRRLEISRSTIVGRKLRKGCGIPGRPQVGNAPYPDSLGRHFHFNAFHCFDGYLVQVLLQAKRISPVISNAKRAWSL